MKLGNKLRVGAGDRRHYARPCYNDGCPSMVLTKASRKLCVPCLDAKEAAKAARPRKRPYKTRLVFQESPAVIEAAYEAAIAQIKARPRAEPDLKWTSPLARL